MNAELRTPTPDRLKNYLGKHLDAIQSVANRVITPDRMVRLVCAAASREPALLKCTPLSILRATMQAAELGLEVCSGKNEAYLIPRWNKNTKSTEATFLPGYQGLIKLVCDSGQVRNVEARLVYAKDITFEVEQGTNPHITHRPTWEKDRGAIVAVYAVAFFPDGTCQFEVMPWHEIEAIRDRSKDKEGFSPWKTDEGEMGRKTAVRRLSKYLRKSPELARALEIQARAEAGDYELEPPALVPPTLVRPGDELPPETDMPRKTLNEDGDLETVWTDEERAAAKAECEDMTERLLESGMSERDAEALMVDRWNGIGLPDLSYGTWRNRFLAFRASHIKEVPPHLNPETAALAAAYARNPA